MKMPSFRAFLQPRLATIAKKRYPNIPSMAQNPSLEEEFIRNAEYLRLRLEFEELRRLLRRYKKPELLEDRETLPAFNLRGNRDMSDVSFSQFDRPIKWHIR
jgi:hypothetical protein